MDLEYVGGNVFAEYLTDDALFVLSHTLNCSDDLNPTVVH